MASTRSRQKALGAVVVLLLLAVAVACAFGGKLFGPNGVQPWLSTPSDERRDEEADKEGNEGAEGDKAGGGDSGTATGTEREEAEDLSKDLGWEADVRMGSPISHDAEGNVVQAASAELERYRLRGDCVLCRAGYLDLLGDVWGCLVQGPGWVEMCVVEEHEDGIRSTVRTVRMEEEEWGQKDADE